MHYQRLCKQGPPPAKPNKHCEVVGCGRPFSAKGLCKLHYRRTYRDVKPRGVPKSEPLWLAQIKTRLGLVKDVELAQEVGVSPSSILHWRKWLGIPAVDSKLHLPTLCCANPECGKSFTLTKLQHQNMRHNGCKYAYCSHACKVTQWPWPTQTLPKKERARLKCRRRYVRRKYVPELVTVTLALLELKDTIKEVREKENASEQAQCCEAGAGGLGSDS